MRAPGWPLIAYVDYMHRLRAEPLDALPRAPVCLATWMLGRAGGIAFSIAAVAAWWSSISSRAHGYTHWFYRYWETAHPGVTWLGLRAPARPAELALAHADERFVTVLARTRRRRLRGGQPKRARSSTRTSSCAGGVREWPAQCARHRAALARRRRRPGTVRSRGRPPAGRAGRRVAAAGISSSSRRPMRWMDGRTVRLQLATDITERAATEERSRQQQERMQITARLVTVGEMATTLAHELNQPLAAITNYSMGCVRRLRSGNWDAELLDAMEKGAAQAERASKVIQRVRAFIRARRTQSCRATSTRSSSGAPDRASKRAAERACLELDRRPYVHADRS